MLDKLTLIKFGWTFRDLIEDKARRLHNHSVLSKLGATIPFDPPVPLKLAIELEK